MKNRFFTTLLIMFLGSFSLVGNASESKPYLITVIGAPGTGPMTMALQISKKYAIPVITPASLVQEFLHDESSIGQEVRETILNQEVLEDTLLFRLFSEYVEKESLELGLIIEGFPQTLLQAHAMHEALKAQFSILCFHLDVADKALIERGVQRLVCSSCGYVTQLVRPEDELVQKCPQCQYALKQREADRQKELQKQLLEFHTRVDPILTFFEEEGYLHTIDGNKYVGEHFTPCVIRDMSQVIEAKKKERSHLPFSSFLDKLSL